MLTIGQATDSNFSEVPGPGLTLTLDHPKMKGHKETYYVTLCYSVLHIYVLYFRWNYELSLFILYFFSLPSPVSCTLPLRQHSRGINLPHTRPCPSIPSVNHLPRGGPRCTACMSHDPKALQSLLVISTPAPLVRRPGFFHASHNSSGRRDPHLSKGQWGAGQRLKWKETDKSEGRKTKRCEKTEEHCECDEDLCFYIWAVCLHICADV